MVAQTNANVNGEFEQRFANSSNGNQYIASLCESLRKRGRERDMITAEILDGSNDRAYEILRQFGFNDFIPGTMYATKAAVCRFFGSGDNYLNICFGRNDIKLTSCNDEYIVTSKQDFCKMAGIPDDVQIPGPIGNKCVHSGVYIAFMSAKLILSYCSIGRFFKLGDSNSTRAKLYGEVCTSAYGEDARAKMIVASEQKRAEARAAEEAERIAAEQDAAEFVEEQRHEEAVAMKHQSASIPMSEETFRFVVETITQSVANVLKQQAEPKQEEVKSEKYLPSNWGYICTMIREKQISIANAAKIFDMEYGDFYRIYRQYQYSGKENDVAPILVPTVAS